MSFNLRVGAITINRAATKEFIAKCRAAGRVSIDDAVEIAERVGLFDSNNPGQSSLALI